ncbi:ribosomal protein S5 domain 2-type protein [Blastocladiella britannica]|nr:ribosomal protein S5 domain 2-type protein [Blastocladiella britannica]
MVNPLISPAESEYITRGIAENLRADGRGRNDFRHLVLETGVLANASGSCRLQIDDTDVLVGVKVDVGDPDADTPSLGRIECSVDCAPTITANLESAVSLADLQLELTQLLARRFTAASLPMVDFGSLSIIAGESCFVLYLDAMVLASGGNVEDAIFLAAKAALATTVIPAIELVDLADGSQDYELVDDPSRARAFPGAEDLPLCVTVSQIGHRFVLDASVAEEHVASSRVHVFTARDGRVAHMQMAGHGGVDPTLLREMTAAARQAAIALHEKLALALERERAEARANKRKDGPLKWGFLA